MRVAAVTRDALRAPDPPRSRRCPAAGHAAHVAQNSSSASPGTRLSSSDAVPLRTVKPQRSASHATCNCPLLCSLACLHSRAHEHAVTEMSVLCMVVKQGPNFLFCTPKNNCAQLDSVM
jgi:hypothetical protein